MSHEDLLIPVRKCRRLPGRLRLGRLVTLYGAPEDDLPLRQLREDLEAAGLQARCVGSPGPATISLLRDKSIREPEGYRLTIRPGGEVSGSRGTPRRTVSRSVVEVRSAGAAGAFYGVQTLRELIALSGGGGRGAGRPVLPAVDIEDAPDIARRGVYHDCSRGKVPKVTSVRQLIERLASWKINELQLYIENTFCYRSHPAIGRGYSPFTAADILAIQDHARAHHVRLVGSLASFGHMEKILCLPQYRRLAEATDFAHDFKGDLCPTDPRSIRLLADLYGEFLPLLEADDFNACCDETRQIGKGRSRKLAQKIGVGRLYLDFVLKIRELCRRHGKRLNIWGDIVLAHPEILPEVPRDIVMLNWDYHANGSRIDRTGEFARAELPLVCCPGTNGWQSHGTRMQQAIDNVAKFAAIARQHRAEGLLNTDWGDYGHRNTLGVSLHGFAHGAAHAWNGAAVEEKAFARRFCRQLFGEPSGKLAAAIRELGAYPHGDLYHALVEPFEPEGNVRGYRAIGNPRMDVPAIQRRLEQAQALRFPALKGLPEFQALALEEFELARRMDLLACQRILAGRQLREGRKVPARTLRGQAADMAELSEEFSRLWHARNKPSRLRDNLRAMRATIKEAQKLAR